MISIKKVESEGLFKSECQERFKFIIGDYATYNQHYSITIQQDNLKTEIGLQCIDSGFEPQAELLNDKLLVGAGQKFYVYNADGKLIKEYPNGFIFYQFATKAEGILVVSELSVMLLDSKTFEIVWECNVDGTITDFDLSHEKYVEIRSGRGDTKKVCLGTGRLI
ncbi:MAG: hypothetical protein FWD86_00035 [Firmicutes bacterium]|nr:hypothetical protein [Bacillota bacterium]